MGNKKSKEADPADPSISGFKSAPPLASNHNDRGKNSNKEVFSELEKMRRENEAINLVLNEKNSILRNGIQLKAKDQMSKGINKQPWELLEKIKFDIQKVVEMISCDLSNSKVYEMLCNNLTTASNLEELILVNCNLNQFPKFLPRTLKKLDLKENLIQEVNFTDKPDERLEITYLDLSSNQLREIPENLPLHLVYLQLQKNQIQVANKSSFEELNSLLSLNLSGNQIEEVGFTTKIFTSLFELNLGFNKIVKLNKGFFYPSKNLINFSLCKNPLIELDNSIGDMNKLERLDLRATKLKKLPTGLSQILTLKSLLIENVFLTEPPMFIVKKGFEAIMQYLKKNHVVEPSKKDIVERIAGGLESVHEVDKEEKSDDNDINMDLLGLPSLQKAASSRMDVPRLSKEEFREVAKWLNYNLNTSELTHLKFFLMTVINDIDSDIDKSLFTFNAILQIFTQYMKEVQNGSKKFEVSASSAYFLGRIGEYPTAVDFLNKVGFKLVSKPFLGLVLTLKAKKKHFDLVKKFKQYLEAFMKVFKNSRMQEQFVPDYFFRKS